MRLTLVMLGLVGGSAAPAVTCSNNFVDLEDQCVLLAEWKNVCADSKTQNRRADGEVQPETLPRVLRAILSSRPFCSPL